MRKRFFLPLLFGVSLLISCKTEQEPETTFHSRIPFRGKPYDLQAVDLNQDGLEDLIVTDHGKTAAEVFIQKKDGGFSPLQFSLPVGFHPGHLFFDSKTARLLEAAEGDGKIRVFAPATNGEWQLETEFAERSPERLTRFHWPAWEDTWVISPYHQNHVVLYKDFDPVRGVVKDRREVPFSEQTPSVVEPERPEIVDLDGDGFDELLYVARISRQVIVLKSPKGGSDVPVREVLLENQAWGIPHEALAADLNGNGSPDLMMADETQPGMIRLLLNDGQGHLAEVSPLDPLGSDGISKIATALDQDGARLVAATEFNRLSLYKMVPGWKPGADAAHLSLSWRRNHPEVLLLKDINRDGWLDLVTAVQNGPDALWVAYGPLWPHFEQLGPDFQLNSPVKEKSK